MMKDLFARLNPLRADTAAPIDGAALDRRLAALAQAADLSDGRLAPAAVSRLATSLAVIGTRGLSLRS